jgi:ketosteroid isomerase-like protein
MRNLVLQAATFLIMAMAAFSQQSAVSATASEASQRDEQQIRQLEEEMLKGEMNSDPAAFEKILADDCLILPAGPDFTKAKLIEGVHKSEGKALPYNASEEDMHVYMLGDTAVAMYVKQYALRANANQVDRQDLTDVFVRSAGTSKLKISRSSPLRKTES